MMKSLYGGNNSGGGWEWGVVSHRLLKNATPLIWGRLNMLMCYKLFEESDLKFSQLFPTSYDINMRRSYEDIVS